MKNIITIALIFILPLAAYFIMSKNSDGITANARENNNPNLYVFTSTMCMDCKKMKSVLNEVEPAYSSRVNFVHINALDSSKKVQDKIKKYKVTLVPTIIYADANGNQKNMTEGYIPKEQLISEIEELING